LKNDILFSLRPASLRVQRRLSMFGRDRTTRRANQQKPVQSARKKYFCFSETQISLIVRASHPNEGRLAIVTNVAVRCGGRDAVQLTRACNADGEVVWSSCQSDVTPSHQRRKANVHNGFAHIGGHRAIRSTGAQALLGPVFAEPRALGACIVVAQLQAAGHIFNRKLDCNIKGLTPKRVVRNLPGGSIREHAADRSHCGRDPTALVREEPLSALTQLAIFWEADDGCQHQCCASQA
jgi:hypothetical protein